MTQKQNTGLNAIKLRILLIFSMVAIVVITIFLLFFFRGQLAGYAAQVTTDKAAASVSESDISKLENLKQQLEENSIAVTRAKKIVADSQYYEYQNQILEQLTAYAKKAGISISGFSFATADNSTPGAAAPAAGSGAAKPAPAGLKSTSVSINIKNPVDYNAIMRFIHYIEANLTKMQVSGVALSRGEGRSVSASPITIEVYTR